MKFRVTATVPISTIVEAEGIEHARAKIVHEAITNDGRRVWHNDDVPPAETFKIERVDDDEQEELRDVPARTKGAADATRELN
jgi:hypothetical protein